MCHIRGMRLDHICLYLGPADRSELQVLMVIPPFLTGCIRRIHAAIFSFRAGVMPPMPMLGRSLLQVHN